MSTVYYNVSQGKRKREELTLPILHFAAADGLGESWIETLGHRAFCAWLTLHTLVDRTDEAEIQYQNRNTVPRSIQSLAKDIFKCDKKTFYNKIIKPLWNHGLIDIVEWKEHKKIGQKAHNIIVYHYPQNEKQLETQPLQKTRDYETDYSSSAKTYADRRKTAKDTDIDNRGKNSTVRKLTLVKEYHFSDRGKNSTVTVKKIPRSTVVKFPHSNKSNTGFNKSNTQINNSNSFNSSSSYKPEGQTNDDDKNKASYTHSLFQQAVSSNTKYRELGVYLDQSGISLEYMTEIIAILYKDEVPFSRRDAAQQLEFMINKMQSEPINNFVYYFVNGLKLRSNTKEARDNFQNDRTEFMYNTIDFKKKDEGDRPQTPEMPDSIRYYNWLED